VVRSAGAQDSITRYSRGDRAVQPGCGKRLRCSFLRSFRRGHPVTAHLGHGGDVAFGLDTERDVHVGFDTCVDADNPVKVDGAFAVEDSVQSEDGTDCVADTASRSQTADGRLA
jgi:hypothetical protein